MHRTSVNSEGGPPSGVDSRQSTSECQRAVPKAYDRAEKRHLPRLDPAYYRGRAFVHWTLSIENRATGWLSSLFHSRFDSIMLHACARWRLVCPTYALMPDHIHVLMLGLATDSDQRLAVDFLRRHLRPMLTPYKWQRQCHDHVLRERDRECGAFTTIANYVLENPVRAGMVAHWTEYSYCGCIVPGYPEFELRMDGYWERFWRCYNYLVVKFDG